MLMNQSHLASLFENATEGIILANEKAEIVLVNPAAQRIFGYTGEELVGRKIELLIPARFHGHHEKVRSAFYHEPQNRVMGEGRDLFGRKKNGSDIPVEVSLSHYQHEGKIFVIAFVIDITRRKEIENSVIEQKKELETVTEQIRKMNAQLEAKVEERTQILQEALNQLEKSQQDLREALSKERELSEIKSRFVSMASHEFRTPLSSVLSSASLLSKYKQGDEQEKRDKHIRRIKDSVKHLNDLLEDFLSLGKLEEGKVQVLPLEFDVKEFLEETIEEIKTILKPGQTIRLTYEGSKAFYTDKRLLKNILINLMSNATKFSDENKEVDLVCKCDGDKLVITVKDRGIGIAEEDQPYMFSSFYRGRNATNIQGTGLGLHIVKRYLDLIDGTVILRSKLGEGTEISFTLPSYR
jgi:PAS domain S-box-containing protein